MAKQYAYHRAGKIVLISIELYAALPDGTVLYDQAGRQHQKGKGHLSATPDFRGQHMSTAVGFEAREDDPQGLFMAPYRDV
jgi:hypothetical protein